MSLTTHTYTPSHVCRVCGLAVAKICVGKEVDETGVWSLVRTIENDRGLTLQELANEVLKLIDENQANWCIQIFIWKNGLMDLAPPHLVRYN